MHSSGSAILTVLERARNYIDEPTSDGKYDNDFMVRHFLAPSQVDVLARLDLDAQNLVYNQHSIATIADVSEYQLPVNIQEIVRLVKLNEEGRIIQDWKPRGYYHPRGQGWRVEGNLLVLDPAGPVVPETWVVMYLATGDILPHYATDGVLDEALTTLSLTGAPTYGALDRRDGAYAGQMLRLLPPSGVIEERLVASHDVETNSVTVRRPFIYHPQGEGVNYEVTQAGMQAMVEAVSLRSAQKLGASRSISEKKMGWLVQEYKQAMKTLGDNFRHIQTRTSTTFERDTVDNPERTSLGLTWLGAMRGA